MELDEAIAQSIEAARNDPETPKKMILIRYDAIMSNYELEQAQRRGKPEDLHKRYKG